MRPVVLDMNGFASFREPARVDFADADFFALVGPTGSGKSTVIDAMTFALYGSVPRWGRKGMVSLALAPTVARATVRLVFDVEDQRYVVARELRRAGAGVSQRAASLERLGDPRGRAEPGDPTDVLAKDLAGVSEAVERLLGLSYEDFCQCVVLPQGQFASFLHAKASERQEILLRLLGAEHYRQMMGRANQRASVAGQKAATLGETLAAFADATPAAEEACRAAEAGLAGLRARVASALPRLDGARLELAGAEGELARLEAERAALAAVRIPGEVAGLDASLTDGRLAAGQAQAAEKLAEEADRAGRDALAAGPDRAALELTRERRREHGELAARRPAVEAEVAGLAARSGQAEAEVSAAAAGLDGLRARLDEAGRAAEAAELRARELGAEHDALAAVTVPAGAGQLDERRQAASDADREASAALAAAEETDRSARTARSSAVAPGALEQARRDAGELDELTAALAPARAAAELARGQRAAADTALAAAEAARERCRHEAEAARRAHAAADLRPHLVAGQPCPVCEQRVEVLPAPVAAAAIDAAQARLDEAGQAVAVAQGAARAAASAEDRAAAAAEAAAGLRGRLAESLAAALAGPLAAASLPATAALAGVFVITQDLAQPAGHGSERSWPAPAAGAADDAAAGAVAQADPAGRADDAAAGAAIAELDASLAGRRRLDETAEAAAAAADTARHRTRSAQDALHDAEAGIAAARDALRAARDPLVRLGAPPLDGLALAAAWAHLAAWAADQARARAAGLADARPAAQAAARQRDAARAELGQADAGLARLRAGAVQAARAEQDARTRLAELAGRAGELARLLQDAPDEAEVTAQLTRRGQLEAAAAAADRQLRTARAGRAAAEHDLAGLERAESAGRARLSAARDPVVGLGAPALDDGGPGLLAGWTALADWAGRQLAARDQASAAARARVDAARSAAGRQAGELSADLAASGIDLAPAQAAAGAAAAVAAAIERAGAATRRIAERRAHAAGLAAQRDDAQADQQVARLLGDLLRSDRFPRWLVTAAVDDLVADASVKLAGLSGGQFDLTHEDGDFYVIDHADADSRRSVRTLSGGETFQASLALALALSAQMSGLAAAGAARLDSIFLDEGFGTLDPETLEVVATTLETLAQGQRMVGVITHVAALAERVPVRFLVSRDARTSSVVREGPAAEGAA
jgi:exonuclease SbcC